MFIAIIMTSLTLNISRSVLHLLMATTTSALPFGVVPLMLMLNLLASYQALQAQKPKLIAELEEGDAAPGRVSRQKLSKGKKASDDES